MIRRKSPTGAPPGASFLPYGVVARSFNVIAAAPVLATLLLFALALFAAPPPARASELPVVLVLGDSLTSGRGLPEELSFPAQLRDALARNGYPAIPVINGGVSGDTSAGGLARLDWMLADRPDLVIVELGANDMLRGVDPAVTRANLDQIIRRIVATGAHVLLAGMRAPPNLGRNYGAAFESLYSELANEHGIAFYPFFLEGVAAVPALNQKDRIHPNAKGVSVIVAGMLPVVIDALAEAAR